VPLLPISDQAINDLDQSVQLLTHFIVRFFLCLRQAGNIGCDGFNLCIHEGPAHDNEIANTGIHLFNRPIVTNLSLSQRGQQILYCGEALRRTELAKTYLTFLSRKYSLRETLVLTLSLRIADVYRTRRPFI
jgi:hypothetical protein